MKFYIHFIVSFILLAGFLSCSGTVKESEPDNDIPGGAKVLRSGDKATGTFQNPKGFDRDFWQVDLSEPTMIRADLSGVKGVDSEIVLYSHGSSVPVKIINDAQSSLGEMMGPILVEPPYALVEVRTHHRQRGTLSDLPYILNISTFEPSPPVEHEPNDTVEEATPVTGKYVIGYYSNVYRSDAREGPLEIERDFYRVDFPEDERYIIQVELTGVSGVDPILRIYDESKTIVKTVDERGLGQGEILSSLGIQGPTIMYFAVNAKDQKISMSEYYELRFEQSEYQSRFEFEPNDSKETASLLNEEKTEGELADPLDVDYFRYENTFNYPVQLSLLVRPDEKLDMQIDAEGNVYNDAGAGEDEGLSSIILPPGESFVFRLSSLNHPGGEPLSYKITMNAEQPTEFSEREPNNSRSKASELLPDTTITGYLNPNNDSDFFVVSLEKRDTYKIVLGEIPGCQAKLQIMDASGAVYETKTSKKSGEGISAGVLLEKKSYLRVSCESAQKNLFRSPYKLSLLSRELWEKTKEQ